MSVVAALLASCQLTMGTGTAFGATSCTSSGHCYTMVRLGVASSPYGFRGVYVNMHPKCMQINSSSYFLTSETWLANYVGSSTYWIEAGVAVGAPKSTSKYFYWADNRPSYGYFEHDDGSDTPSSSQFYGIGISPNSNDTSYFAYVGPYSGNSSLWPAAYVFDHLDAGTETSTGGVSHYLTSTKDMGLFYGTNGNSFRDGWYYDSGENAHNASTWNSVNTITADHYYSYYNETSC